MSATSLEHPRLARFAPTSFYVKKNFFSQDCTFRRMQTGPVLISRCPESKERFKLWVLISWPTKVFCLCLTVQ